MQCVWERSDSKRPPRLDWQIPARKPGNGRSLEPHTARSGPELRVLPFQQGSALQALRQRLRPVPHDNEVDHPRVSASFGEINGLCPMPSGAAEPLHDAFPNGLGQGGGQAEGDGQPVLPVPSDDRLERHQGSGLVQAPLSRTACSTSEIGSQKTSNLGPQVRRALSRTM